MKVNLKAEKTNEIFGREEMELEIEHPEASTPSKAALQQYISKEKGKDPECVEIINIISNKGNSLSKSSVYLWNEKKTEDLSKKKEEASPKE